MVNLLKQIGKGTTYEFKNQRIFTPMPPRNGTIKEPNRIIDNEWYDKSGNCYKLYNNTLYILYIMYYVISEITSDMPVFDVSSYYISYF